MAMASGGFGQRAGMIAAVLAATCGCGRAAPAPPAQAAATPWFVDVTDRLGLHFAHDAGETGNYFMPQIMGSGAALFDCDNDGRLDILLLQNAGPNSRATNRLFRQQADGRFVDISRGSGLDTAGYGMGAAVGDVNNDGWADLCVTEYGRTRLFLNNHNRTFTDISSPAGIDNPSWGTSACFFDYDRDGWLDLVIVNYVAYDPRQPCGTAGGQPDYCHPLRFPGTTAKLYRNAGPSGGTVRFQDKTLGSGLGGLPGRGLGVVCADFNGDRWPDIFVANDAHENRLWMNQRDGRFHDNAVLSGVAYNGVGQVQANMGVALGDVDGDAVADLFVTHLTEETNTLWQQVAPGEFRDRSATAGLTRSHWRATGFGTVLADFDHDGAPDVAVANGRVARGPSPAAGAASAFWGYYVESNQLFQNDGTGRFRDISLSNAPFCGKAVSRGLATGDLDGDGAIDLLVTTVAGPARLFRNVVPQRGHWLIVRAVDPALSRDMYGAEVTVEAGGRRWLRHIHPAGSYLSSSAAYAHFGLGQVAAVDRVQVIWPDGTSEQFAVESLDRSVTFYKGQGQRRDAARDGGGAP